jgi:hypothetical protein
MDTSFHTPYNEHLEHQCTLYFDRLNVLHENIGTIKKNKKRSTQCPKKCAHSLTAYNSVQSKIIAVEFSSASGRQALD